MNGKTNKQSSSASGLPQKCQKCKKVVQWNSRKGHAMVHNKIYRYSCSLCEFKAHWKCNIKRHHHVKHMHLGPIGAIGENNSPEFLNEKTRSVQECFSEVYKGAPSMGTSETRQSDTQTKTEPLQSFMKKLVACQMCQVRVHPRELQEHAAKHLPKFRFRCSTCRSGSDCKREMDIHVKVEHLLPSHVLDIMNVDKQSEIQSLVERCFPLE